MAIVCPDPKCEDLEFRDHPGEEDAYFAGVHNALIHSSTNGPATART